MPINPGERHPRSKTDIARQGAQFASPALLVWVVVALAVVSSLGGAAALLAVGIAGGAGYLLGSLGRR
jgi:hypothetical protein